MGRMDALMQTVAICKEFGWTYQEFHEQPAFFIAAIRAKLMRDQKEVALKQQRRG